MSFINIHDGRKVQFRINDLVSFWSRLETGKDQRLADGNVLMHDNASGRRANNSADFAAHRNRHVPPALSPRAHSTRRPCFSVFLESRVSLTGHGTQTVR